MKYTIITPSKIPRDLVIVNPPLVQRADSPPAERRALQSPENYHRNYRSYQHHPEYVYSDEQGDKRTARKQKMRPIPMNLGAKTHGNSEEQTYKRAEDAADDFVEKW